MNAKFHKLNTKTVPTYTFICKELDTELKLQMSQSDYNN